MEKKELLYKSPSIFIADDDEDDVHFVRAAVKELNSGIELKHFTNGKQLLQALKNSDTLLPNFILLDLNMPILDGRETLKLIRQEFASQNLPVIVLSTSSHDKEQCFRYGANNYYTKPYSYPKYLEIIRNLKQEWIDRVEA